MTLREAIEQYILWRQAHGAKFTTGANLLRQFLGYADGDADLRRGHHGAGSGLSGGRRTADPTPREQVLRPCRLLALCDQPWPCDAVRRCRYDEPRSPIRAPPYIYSRDELRRLLDPRPWRAADAARFSSTR